MLHGISEQQLIEIRGKFTVKESVNTMPLVVRLKSIGESVEISYRHSVIDLPHFKM